jgi:hypothetical protein
MRDVIVSKCTGKVGGSGGSMRKTMEYQTKIVLRIATRLRVKVL